jgi:alpha-L-rhamnosidase
VSAVGLRTESLDSPLGVETSRPRLSWRIEGDRRGIRQSAYRIQVASTVAALDAGDPDLWDSGRVDSDNSIGIRYDGKRLASRQRCLWRVQIWDERGVLSAPSAMAFWEMGLLDPADWSAKWLAAEDEILYADRLAGLVWIKGPPAPRGAPTRFRLDFFVPTTAAATLFVATHGKIDIWMDGQAIPVPMRAPLLGPPPTPEIALCLGAGRHVLAVAVGPPASPLEIIGVPDSEIAPFLRICLADGTVMRLNGEGWRVAQAEAGDWHTLEFDDRNWPDALPVREPRPQLWPTQAAILLRHAFSASKAITRARIYATALGAYEIYLNGCRVGDALLAPESADFRKRALYQVYDVTKHIVVGENVIGAIVGDGWYASYMVVVGRYSWGLAPRSLLTQLELTFADGAREVIESGPRWQASRSPIVSSEIYDGEHYDARLEQASWSTASFDASHWFIAQLAPVPSIALSAQVSPPIRRIMVLTARAVREVQPGRFVFDFAQNCAGWCRLKVRGSEGAVVELRYAEAVTGDGEIDRTNLRSALAADTYVLKGSPSGEIFEPHFTYHGFRYVEVTGFPGTPTPENLDGIVVHSDLPLTGSIDVSEPLIQSLWRNAHWGQRSNFIGIPTDCPQRDERLGWLGDAGIFWDAAAFNMDVAAFTRRFMGDVRDAQGKGGAFADFNPKTFKVHLSEDGKLSALPDWTDVKSGRETGASPGWADGGILLPWTVWRRYGDTEIIEENWQVMARYLQFVADSNPQFIWRNDRGSDYGDWLALDAKNLVDATTPKDLVATAIWANSVACMAEMANATARTSEECSYRALWANISAAFQRNFIAADGTVGNASHTSYILALRFNLVPDALRSAAAAKLAEDITRRGTLLSTGFLGTPHSLDVLADAGYCDLVYSLLLRTDFPSWGYMVSKGATTIWESWDADVDKKSLNHYALGAVCGFIFRRIAGIAPLEPGFRKIEVRPLFDPRVRRGGGKYDSVLGRIVTQWQQLETGGLTLDLTVPPNAKALVYLPATQGMKVTESRQPISGNGDIREVSRTKQQAIVEVASGNYRFEVG